METSRYACGSSLRAKIRRLAAAALMPALVTLAVSAQAQPDQLPVSLTAEEKAWLETHTKVRVMVGTWPPFHFVDDGEPKGLALDYVTTILGDLGLEVEFVPILWHEALAGIGRLEKVDLLPTIARSEERERLVHITEDYLSFPYVIFTRRDAPFVGSITDMAGKTVAVENNFISHQRLRLGQYREGH